MAKTPQQRFDDTITFIRENKKPGISALADHIITTAAEAGISQTDLGEVLSLGKRNLKPADLLSWDEDSQQRRALRALLLCQRLYFSQGWARAFNNNVATQTPRDFFPGGNWDKTLDTSLAYWKPKKDTEILDALQTFVITSENPESLVTAAQEAGNPKAPMPDVTLTRKMKPFPNNPICFDAVRHWLFQSGICSYRWYLRTMALNPRGCRTIFGTGKIIWEAKRPFQEGDILPAVKKGYIVFLAAPEREGGAGGHWLVSTGEPGARGGGAAYGRNNDIIDGTVRAYALADLSRQFLEYKRERKAEEGQKKGEHRVFEGIVEVFNPIKIPNRI